MKYETLLFDADGTLFDFKKSEREAFKSSLKMFNIDASEQMVATYSEINDCLWKMLERGETTKSELRVKRFEIFANKYGCNISPTELADAYFYQLSTKSYLIDNAYDICEKLSKNHSLYIITNGFKTIQMKRFYESPISKFFLDIFISEDIGAEKPSQQYFEIISSLIARFNKKKTLIIGDSLSSDIRGGINFGIDVCWFNPNHYLCPKDIKINYTISTLNELYHITNK